MRDIRLLITLPLLRQLIQSFQHTAASAYLKCLVSAMCSLAFYAFLRVGEISTTTGSSNNLIHISQLDRLVDKQGNVKVLQLSLCHYKHSVSGQPFDVYIYTEDICCPVQLILNYVSLRGHSPFGPMGRLFLEHFLLPNLMQLSSLTTLIHPCIKVLVFT